MLSFRRALYDVSGALGRLGNSCELTQRSRVDSVLNSFLIDYFYALLETMIHAYLRISYSRTRWVQYCIDTRFLMVVALQTLADMHLLGYDLSSDIHIRTSSKPGPGAASVVAGETDAVTALESNSIRADVLSALLTLQAISFFQCGPAEGE